MFHRKDEVININILFYKHSTSNNWQIINVCVNRYVTRRFGRQVREKAGMQWHILLGSPFHMEMFLAVFLHPGWEIKNKLIYSSTIESKDVFFSQLLNCVSEVSWLMWPWTQINKDINFTYCNSYVLYSEGPIQDGGVY
jgi:hypothetical protein